MIRTSMTDDHTVAAKAFVDIIARMACRPVWSLTLCGDQDYLAMRQGRRQGFRTQEAQVISCQTRKERVLSNRW